GEFSHLLKVLRRQHTLMLRAQLLAEAAAAAAPGDVASVLLSAAELAANDALRRLEDLRARGFSRSALAAVLAGSPGFLAGIAAAAAQRFLHRPAAGPERLRLTRLLRRRGEEELVAVLLSSPEYFVLASA